MSSRLKILMLITDLGFIAYWSVTALHLIPAAEAFKDYSDPVVSAWNWSFLPLDLLISATGLLAVVLATRDQGAWRSLAIASLTLTVASGLMAVGFWSVRGDFDVAWWGPNLYLLLYPLFFVPALVSGTTGGPLPGDQRRRRARGSWCRVAEGP